VSLRAALRRARYRDPTRRPPSVTTNLRGLKLTLDAAGADAGVLATGAAGAAAAAVTTAAGAEATTAGAAEPAPAAGASCPGHHSFIRVPTSTEMVGVTSYSGVAV
jgi:hypothetical protein